MLYGMRKSLPKQTYLDLGFADVGGSGNLFSAIAVRVRAHAEGVLQGSQLGHSEGCAEALVLLHSVWAVLAGRTQLRFTCRGK